MNRFPVSIPQPTSWLKGIIFLLPLLFFAAFYFYPLTAIFSLSFAPDGRFQLDTLSQLISRPLFARTLWFTIWQAAASTLLTLLLALPGAYIFARYQFPGKSSLKAFITLPFVLPTVVVANAFTALIGPRGLLNEGLMGLFDLASPPIQLDQTIWIILLAHVFYNYSIALRMISGFWQNLPINLTQAAQMLGASRRRAFIEITLPLLAPVVLAAAVLIFIFCFTSFGVILILGGPRYATLEVEIYRQAVNLFNLPLAAALSLLQILFTFTLMWVYTQLQARLSFPLRLQAAQATAKPIRHWWDGLLVGSNLLIMLLLLGAPLLALVTRSFWGSDGWTLRFYQELFINRRDSVFFVPPVEAIVNSVGFGLITVLLATTLGLFSTLLIVRASQQGEMPTPLAWVGRWFGRVLDPLLMLPLATSAVTLGFGFILALNRPPFDLRSSAILIPIAHTLIGMPFVIRSLLPAIRSINPRLREAASLLGAAPGRVWLEIDWPLMRRALLVGAVFAFTVSMGEFGATLFLARPQTPTLPVAIFRFLGQPGALNYGQALAMSTLLMGVCAAGFLAIERFRLGDEGEF